MQNILKHALLVSFVVISFASQAQQQAEMADTMRSNGKIYVVVGVIVIILTGLFAYLFSLDKKVSRIEKSLDKGPKTK